MIVFDVETEALPDDELARVIPAFDPVAAIPDCGAFDANSVKTGNIKDPVKIHEKIEAARADHAALAASVDARREAARADYFAKFKERAALSATTGRVLAIGARDVEKDGPAIAVVGERSEGEIISDFWLIYEGHAKKHFVGHNIFGFDLPFMVRRSWMLGIEIPRSLLLPGGAGFPNGRNWSSQFIDTMAVWGCGSRNDFVSLDVLDKALGGPGKPEGVDGADFARLFHGTAEEREQALAYLRNDLEMAKRVADALQLV